MHNSFLATSNQRTLNKTGKTYNKCIIMVDEMHTEYVSEKDGNEYMADFSYLAKYENVDFVICMNPALKADGMHSYEIKHRPGTEEKQNFQVFKKRHRNSQKILNFMRFLQKNHKQDDFHYMTVSEDEEKCSTGLPPPFKNSHGVIWIQSSGQLDFALEKTKEIIMRHLETKPTVTYLYDKSMETMKDKLDEMFKSSNNVNYIGEFDAFSFNGVESDIICCRLGSSTSLLQHCSRARRLLIIITDSNAKCEDILKEAENKGIIKKGNSNFYHITFVLFVG